MPYYRTQAQRRYVLIMLLFEFKVAAKANHGVVIRPL